MSDLFYRVPKSSKGRVRCLMCDTKIKRGQSYEEIGTPNKSNVIEYWENVCLSCVAKNFVARGKRK